MRRKEKARWSEEKANIEGKEGRQGEGQIRKDLAALIRFSDQIRSDSSLRRGHPLSERKILMFLFLYYRSVAIRESRGRRDAVRLVEASFTAKKK